MADDAAGSGDGFDRDDAGDGDDERRPSATGPDAHRTTDDSDERRPLGDRNPADRDVDDDDAYRIPLDLSEDRGSDSAGDDAFEDGDEDDSYGPEPSSTPIEPGDPDLESVIFVFLGAIAMVLVLFRVVTLPL